MQRNLKIDGLKFVLMYLVVLGHLPFDDYGLHVDEMIYSFHMPMFVFLSGYLTSSKFNPSHHLGWLKNTFLVFICAQACHMILAGILGLDSSVVASGQFNLKRLFYPQFALWYLLCLMYWRIMTWTVFSKVDDLVLFIGSWLLAVLSGFIPVGEFLSFQRAFSFLPFFVMGVICKRRSELMESIGKIPLFLSIFLFVAGLVISRYFPLYQPKFEYSEMYDLKLRAFQSMIALVMCIALIRVVKDFSILEKISSYGKYTLWIYVGHTFIVVVLKELWMNNVLRYDLVAAMLIAAIICWLFILMARAVHFKESRSLKSVEQ